MQSFGQADRDHITKVFPDCAILVAILSSRLRDTVLVSNDETLGAVGLSLKFRLAVLL